MNKTIKIIGIIIIVILILNIFKKPKTSTDSTNPNAQKEEVANQIVEFFKTQQVISFDRYLEFLATTKNTSENYISKEIYNNFAQNKDKLTTYDVLSKF